MRGEKRKELPESGGKICKKRIKTAATAEEPTDEEVEEFYVILRRMKQAAEYFGVKKGMTTSAVVAAAADQEEKEDEETPEVKYDATAPEGVKRRGKGKEVGERNGLRLDLNIAVTAESDGR